MGTQHIIELNGKQYDALTGKIIADRPTTTIVHTSQSKPASYKNMDGVGRRIRGSQAPSKTHHHPIEKSHTLMRKTVHKPVAHKLHAVATIVNQQPTPSKPHIKPLFPAKLVTKSKLIHRFSPVAIENPPQSIAMSKSMNASSVKTASLSHTAVNAASVVVSPLNQAIANATSHQYSKLKRPRLHHRMAHKLHVSPRTISATAASLAILLIAVFFGYQNISNLKMRVASSRAGLHGTLPAYQPPGFHLGNITYKTGQINISFRSNSDARNFTVTQAASLWNSDTLRDKLKTTGQLSSAVEVPDKGKTLFIYNDSDISWVDGGILYKIEGDSKLNSDQLLQLANSL